MSCPVLPPCVAVLVACLAAVCVGENIVTQSPDGGSGSIKFSTPTLSDEDAHSPWMPDVLKCDSCKVIAYKLWKEFKSFNDKRPSLKYNIPESEIIDMAETVCNGPEAFHEYGVKEVNGVKRISGPGTEAADVAGVTAGGGKWPGRIRDMCEQFVGELGEMAIYGGYKKQPKSRKALENYLCRGEGIQGECMRVETTEGKDEL